MRSVLMVALLGALMAPAVARADPLTDWTGGPDAALDDTYDGNIDLPTMNSTVSGNFTVAGWFVDRTAQGWAGADDIQVWLGTMDGGGQMLADAQLDQNRTDVANAEGNPFFQMAGFTAVVPSGAVGQGAQTLSVYAHTPGKGWWYKQVNVTVAPSAAPAGAPAPAAGPVSGPPPILVIETPSSGTGVNTKPLYYTMLGYALDKNASVLQGSQGTGIDHVRAFIDADYPSGTALGDADLAFSDTAAGSKYGAQFANSGWRLTFKPTNFKSGNHTIWVHAHSVVTDSEDVETVTINIVENG